MKLEKKNVVPTNTRAHLMWVVLLIEIILPFMLYLGLQNKLPWLAILSGGFLLLGLIILIIIR